LLERHEDHWRLILMDLKHGERVEHDERFDTSAKAQDAALAFARHHIFDKHNDTMLTQNALSWTEL
jgi:hypothetical protein